MDNSVDKKFFAAVKSGDKQLIEAAFGDVYVTYAKLVAFSVSAYVSDRETINDIVGDVFVDFFTHAASVKGSVKYYLTVSARNRAISYLRSIRDIKEVPLEQAENNYSSPAFRSEVIDELNKVLSKEEADVILMHVTGGYTFKEIAAEKHKKLGTVLTIYRRAVQKYKKEVGRYEKY